MKQVSSRGIKRHISHSNDLTHARLFRNDGVIKQCELENETMITTVVCLGRLSRLEEQQKQSKKLRLVLERAARRERLRSRFPGNISNRTRRAASPPFSLYSWVDLAKEECHVLNLNGNYFQRIHLMAHCLRPRRKREREREEENECNDGLSEFTRGVTRFSIRWSVKPTHPRMLARNQKNILSRERYKITIEHI